MDLSWLTATGLQDVQNGRSCRSLFVKGHSSFVAEPGCGMFTRYASRLTDILLSSRQARDLNHRPDFDGPFARHGNLVGNADRLVAILGVGEETAPSCSRVSANRPSVTGRFPSRARTLAAMDVGCNGLAARYCPAE